MPLQHSPNAAVAQWIEYWPPKPRVVGSIPASRAIKNQRLEFNPVVFDLPLVLYESAMWPNLSRSELLDA